MSASHCSRRQFVGTALTTSVITIGGLVTPAFAAVESICRFTLVQSIALPIDSAHIKNDFERNLSRILQIIEKHATPYDWLAFDDAPLTGHAAGLLPATDVSLGDDDLKRLTSAALHHRCWISLGAVRRSYDSILVLSPQGQLFEWPMPPRHAPLPLTGRVPKRDLTLPIVVVDDRRIAVTPMDVTAKFSAECIDRGVDIMITMNSSSGCVTPPTTQVAPSLSMNVHAAAPWQPPGCDTRGLGRSRVLNVRGEVIAECPTADEHVLVLAGL